MKYLTLFENTNAPLHVSQIALGCDHFGQEVAQEQALAVMDAYYEQGGTFFDTAHIYSQKETGGVSLSEATVGKWIKTRGCEKTVVVSSKGAHPERSAMQVTRITERDIRQDLQLSLETLGRDSLDIWFLHRDNPAVPAGEIVDMVSPLVEKGLVRNLGASNWSVKRLAEAQEYAEKNKKHGFRVSQIQWSLAIATPESWSDPTIVCMDGDQQDWYLKQQMPVMVFSPQARGIFSKVIEQGADAVSEKTKRYFLLEQNMGRIGRCRELSEKTGINPAGICLAYLTNAPFPVFPVIGCKNPEQLTDSLRFADVSLAEADRRRLENR